MLAGQRYSFEPVAADENGDALTYSAANLPAWASLDPKTGRITGTPTAADVATYNGIVLSVSDGQSSASLAAFSINVTTVATGAATLSWNPPTQNVDGSALINLTGYRILYGQTSGALDREVKLDNPALSSYMVENLSAGTWYFAVVAVNADGIRSNASNVASKTIS